MSAGFRALWQHLAIRRKRSEDLSDLFRKPEAMLPDAENLCSRNRRKEIGNIEFHENPRT